MAPYREYFPTNGPTVLQGPNNAGKLEQYGNLQDEQTDTTREAVQARFPQTAVANGAADALQYMELERMLDRKTGESDTAFALRIKEAWDRWLFAGTPRGVLKALKDQGYKFDGMDLVQASGIHWTIAPDPSDTVIQSPPLDPEFPQWMSDTDPTFWSKFVILLLKIPASVGWFTSAHLSYSSSTSAVMTFPFPFADTTYNVLTGVHSTSTTPGVRVHTKTTSSLTVATDASFTGTIDVLCWQGNDFPLVSPLPGEKQKICRIIQRWKSGKSNFVEFVHIIRGNYWGKYGLGWGGGGLVWGPAPPDEPITVKVSC